MRRRRVRITWEMIKKFILVWTLFTISLIGFSQILHEPVDVVVGNEQHYNAIKELSETIETKINLNLPGDKKALARIELRDDLDLNPEGNRMKNLREALKEDLLITPDLMRTDDSIFDAFDKQSYDTSFFGRAISIASDPTAQCLASWGFFVFLCWHGYI